MAQQTRSINKSKFEDGDVPQESDYVDLIDSYLSLADTTAQTVTSDLIIPVATITEVSASQVNASAATVAGALSAASVRADNYGAVSATSITASAATIAGEITTRSVVTTALTVSSGANVAITINVDTSVAASSGNTTVPVPATAEGYFPISIKGTTYWVPFFRVAS